MAGGRPRTYSSPEEFDAAVDEYVAVREADGKRLTWTGLALHMGFSSRQAIDVYGTRSEFCDSVKRAKLLVENSYEERLGEEKLAAAGTIFALKNFGWKDKQETEHSGSVQYTNLTDDELERRIAQLSSQG